MRRLPLILLLLLAPAAQAQSPCRAAIAAVEPGSGLPPGLLEAIARVESGRRDPLSGAIEPWPWAVNIGGEGLYAADRAQAVAAVLLARARGVQQIDVGCMQISLGHHPNAFASLEEAFDPPANVAYAARFLRDLRARSADWEEAIGRYHSGTPERAAAYLARVQAVLGMPPGPAAPARDPVVVIQAPEARAVRVVVPGQGAAVAPAGLPRVVTPGSR